MAAPIEKNRVTRFRAPARLRQASAKRKSHLRHYALENLEPRTLLAVLPAATHDPNIPNPIVVGNTNSGNQGTPSITVDPNNPNRLVAAWVRFDPTNLTPPVQSIINAAYSTNGGASWNTLSVPGPIADPTTSNPVQPFPLSTEPSVAFDRNGHFYILVNEHNGTTSTAFVLHQYTFGNASPNFSNLAYYTDQEVPTTPTLAVDNNLPTFTDPDRPTVVQNDPFSGNVYVAWTTQTTAPANVTDLVHYNPNRIEVVASSDGGASFGPVQYLDTTGSSGLERYTSPRLTVSQGTGNLPGGQVSAVWDDTGTGANFSPIPLDLIDSNRIQGGISQGFDSATGAVKDAIDPGNNAPHQPVTTSFAIPVTVDPRFTTLSDVDFTINLLASNLADLEIQLQAPNGGPTVTLMRNQLDASGNTISQFVGSTGANLGINSNGFELGTTFDQQATRSLVDINAAGNGRGAAAPYIGFFRPDNGNLNVFNGMNQTQVNGTWHLLITDVRNDGATPPPQFLLNGTLHLTSGVAVSNQTNVANTTVRATAPTATSAYPLGIVPAATIASDNTLGAFSPFQGRLYVAYVDRFDMRRDGGIANGNPADNTDIFLKASDDGGATWFAPHTTFSVPTPVNDDSAIHDGFSEGTSLADLFTAGTSAHMYGRPQFEPEVAVDQSTGTVVVSYFDARFDASRARVATTIATSIDGGASFGPQAFANTPQTAFDEITRQTDVLGPIPDNQSGGNPFTESTFSYGPRQGLAVSAGHVYPAWSSNENGGLVSGPNENTLETEVAPMVIAAGPRVIASTMGPVGGPNDSLNNTIAADGTPQAHAFDITFDRPVDPNTVTSTPGLPQNTIFLANFETGTDGFTIDNSGGGLWHRSTGRGNDPGHSPTFSMYYGQGEGPNGGGNYNTGTNSGTLTSPVIALPAGTGRNLQLSFNYFLQTEGDATFFDQARVILDDLTTGSSTVLARNNTGNLLDPSVGFQTFTADLTAFAGDTVKLIFSFNTEDPILNNFEGWYVDDVSIIQPVVLPNVNIVARDATGALLPTQPLITNIQALNPGPFGATTFQISFTPQSTPGTYSYSIGPNISDRIRTPLQRGNRMDQNSNGQAGESPGDIYAAPRPLGSTPFQSPYDSTTLPLIVPGPHLVSSHVPGAPATPDNLVTNNTVSSIDVVFDRNMKVGVNTPGMQTPGFDAADVLQIMTPAGPLAGPFTITPNPNGNDPDPNFPRTFRISFPKQELSGTYTIELGSNIQSESGVALDTNLNAGLDALRGNPASGQTTPVTANSTAVPVSIAPGRTITSTIDVTDNFVIQGLTLRLNIMYPNDPDLEATLIAPDGVTQIKLFTKVGATGNHQNFADTVFDDSASTPIQNGGPPFFGRFNPQDPLSVLKGTASPGRYTLQIKNNSTSTTGTLNSWSLTFLKPVPGTGLGEPVADRTSVHFRIFTMDPTNPLSSNTWTAVGPASIAGGGRSGRIGGLAVDPSDPSGNTVFVAGASGGVWKTTNFLTTDPQGPTYIPVTSFGPTFSLNTGSITVFGRNNDPNQSIVFVSTGEGDTGGGQGLNASAGVGMLRSMDGGATWTLLDSSTNVDSAGNPLPINSPMRDHIFVGTTSFKIVVDPKPTISGETIVYVALSGNNGGIWRSLDTGKHWQLMRAGQATDVVLDPNSGFINAVSNPTGNLQIVYGAFRGEGVFISPNQAQGWTLMAGGGGDPLIQDADFGPPPPVAVNAPGGDPTGGKGRIVLAKPFLTGNPLQDLLYEGWLYAAVAGTDDHLDGLYLTKDFGRNWTKIHLANRSSAQASTPGLVEAVPSNDSSLGNYDPLGGPVFAQGNYDISLAIDPTNPNVVYLGGTRDGQPSGLIRVDTTGISDPYSLYLNNLGPDGGAIRANTTDPVTLDKPNQFPLFFIGPPNVYDPRVNPTLNFIQDPANPFVVGATHYVTNTTRFANTGAFAKWTPFDTLLDGSTDQHRVFTYKDPLTGHARLIFGDDQGVFTGVDAGDGTLIQSVGDVSSLSNPGGNVPVVTGSRNGNLQITQFYYGAAQPSNLAAQISVVRGMFYGSAQDDGFPQSDANIVNSPAQPGYGNLNWTGPGGDGGGVATDQTGTGTLYQYKWPCCGGNITDFFQVNQVGRTTGLLQRSLPGNVPDPQWPFEGVVNFAINPINGDQAIISSVPSSAGPARIFRTETQGRFWLPIADPATDSTLDGAQSLALTYGAPDPNAPGGIGSLDNFIYFGTEAGHIYVTFTGGGTTGTQWTDLSKGLDGSPVRMIVTNPTRGSHEAYAVTRGGVYHMVDSEASGATWQNITSNLFQVMHNSFGDPSLAERQPAYTTSIQADWRYVIPDDFSNPNSPTHPMLYVAGEGGVYRSLDNGKSWIHFPDVSLLNTPQEPAGPMQPINADPQGGYLPNAQVTDLDLSLGNINPTTGRPDVSTGPNLLLASTYGRGAFAIRLAPIVFPNSVASNALHFDLTLPNPPGPPNGSDSGVIGDGITNVTDPVIDGLSEQSAFGNVVTINLIDESADPNDPTKWVTIPTVAGTNQTDATGHFSVQIAPGYFKTDGSTDGPKVIGVQAVNASGTKGNIAIFNFTLDTGRPGKPGAPDLEPGSDSGLSNTDNITNVARGAIFDVLPSGPNIIAQNVELLRDGVVVATVQIPAGAVNGVVQLTDPGPVSDGPHIYTAEQIDIASNASLPSDPLTVTLDTVPPNNPAAPTLDPNDDTGTKGDGQTQIRQPHLIGTLVPETVDPVAQVQIIDSNGAVQGTALSSPTGSYSVQFNNPLADGVYSVKIQAEDVAGNLSALSPVFILQINNKLPTKPTISLLPSDDSGLSNTDNITNVSRPHLIGKTDPGLNVDLIDTNGVVTGTPGAVLTTVLSTGLGNYLIQFPSNLKDGVYHIQTQARDAANNKTLSNVLVLTIDTTPPATAPTLMLDPNDDTGIKGDGITSVRRPHFIGAAEPGGVVQIINPTTGAILATTTATAGGNYSAQLANDLNNGTISLEARATDIAGNVGPTSSPPFNVTIITVAGDYDADGKADLAVFRPIAPTSQWFILQSKAGGELVNFGQPGDIPIQGDFDGDGKTDVGLYRPSTATWYVLRSQLGPLTIQFGEGNVDIPVPADYDGDGRTDLAVYRPTTGQWFIIQSSAGGKMVQFGQAGIDRPEPGDYDADGKADLAVYRPTTGQWFILQSSGGGKVVQLGGQPGDMAVPGAYDGGGKTEAAIYRPSMGQWLINGPSSVRSVPLGQANVDIPVPADYDGDGKTDLAVYRPTTGQWFIRQSTAGGRIQQFGAAGLDIPVPEPLDYRAAAGGLQTKSVSNGGNGSGGSGLRAASVGSNSFVNSIAVLAPSGGDGAALHTFAAPVVVPVSGPAASTPPAATSTPASVPTGPAIMLPTGRKLVNTALHRAHQPIRLTQHHERSQHHTNDTTLAAAIHSLGRIKGGRFFPGL